MEFCFLNSINLHPKIKKQKKIKIENKINKTQKFKAIKNKDTRFKPYNYFNKENVLLSAQILNNIKLFHTNANKEQKSNILSVVSYDYIKPVLKEIGFKFSKKQFNTAKKKRLNDNITLNKYKRYIPECKRKLSEEEKNKIIYYLDYYSKESTNINEKIRYLEYSKKFIYQKYYQTDNNRKITYNTFLKYCPKYYKIPKRKTDVCGIYELGNGFKNINISILNN